MVGSAIRIIPRPIIEKIKYTNKRLSKKYHLLNHKLNVHRKIATAIPTIILTGSYLSNAAGKATDATEIRAKSDAISDNLSSWLLFKSGKSAFTRIYFTT